MGGNSHCPQGWREGLPQGRGTRGGCWLPPSAVRAEDSGMAGGCPVLGVSCPGVSWGTTGICGKGSGLGVFAGAPGHVVEAPGGACEGDL